MLQPPLPLQSFLPAQAFDSGTAQPPLPLQSLSPIQQALSFCAPASAAACADALSACSPWTSGSFLSGQPIKERPAAAAADQRANPSWRLSSDFFIIFSGTNQIRGPK